MYFSILKRPMKKLILPLMVLCLAQLFCLAQINFQKTYGLACCSAGHIAVQTQDGGYAVAGYTFAFGAGATDFYLIKTDSMGNLTWSRTYGGTGDERCYHMQETSDKGFILVGYTQSFGPGLPYENGYVVKTDSAGNLQWSYAFGGNGGEHMYNVRQTSDGGYILQGETRDSWAAWGDAYLVKIDSTGAMQWSKKYGSIEPDNARSIALTSDGGYVIGGNLWSLGMWLLKTDSLGNGLWSKTYGAYWVMSVIQTLDGGFIMAGMDGSSIDIIKTDSIGDTLWTKAYGGPTYEEPTTIQHLADSSYVVSGKTTAVIGQNDLITFKLSSQGNLLWTKVYGGTYQDGDGAKSIDVTNDGGYIITGFTESFYGNYNNVYLIKTDENGNSGCNQVSTDILPQNYTFNVADQVGMAGLIVGTLYVPASTIVGSGGSEELLCLSTGIKATDNLDSQTSIYPNPGQGKFTVYSGKYPPTKITVYNVLGEVVHERRCDSVNRTPETVIDISGFAKGIYLLHLSYDTGWTSRKIVIE
jgi:hypothetical protein